MKIFTSEKREQRLGGAKVGGSENCGASGERCVALSVFGDNAKCGRYAKVTVWKMVQA